MRVNILWTQLVTGGLAAMVAGCLDGAPTDTGEPQEAAHRSAVKRVSSTAGGGTTTGLQWGIRQDTVRLYPGATVEIGLTHLTPVNAVGLVPPVAEWSVDDTTIASVRVATFPGPIAPLSYVSMSGHREGETVVRARFADLVESVAIVRVSNRESLGSIELWSSSAGVVQPGSATVSVGDTVRLFAIPDRTARGVFGTGTFSWEMRASSQVLVPVGPEGRHPPPNGNFLVALQPGEARVVVSLGPLKATAFVTIKP